MDCSPLLVCLPPSGSLDCSVLHATKVHASRSNISRSCCCWDVQAVPLDALSEQSALDWLCLNLDAAALPRRYSGGPGQRANASSIKVLAGALARRQQVQEVAAAQQDAAALRKAEAERQRRQAEEAAATRSRQEAR